jgi:hypothetical protein
MELVRRFESGQQVLQSSGFNDNLPRTLNVELGRGFRVKRGEHNSTSSGKSTASSLSISPHNPMVCRSMSTTPALVSFSRILTSADDETWWTRIPATDSTLASFVALPTDVEKNTTEYRGLDDVRSPKLCPPRISSCRFMKPHFSIPYPVSDSQRPPPITSRPETAARSHGIAAQNEPITAFAYTLSG